MSAHPLFLGSSGYARTLRRDDPAAALAIDAELDAALVLAGFPDRFLPPLEERPRRKILAVVAASPMVAEEAAQIASALQDTRHETRIVLDGREDAWKFTKINQAVLPVADGVDWLVFADDDIVLPARVLDDFIAASEAAGLVLAQAAHRIHSFASYAVTQRQPRSIVRATRFVEIGQLVAIHRSIFWKLLPFPETSSGWGIDFLWADWARRHGWAIGVVDATPIEHLRPIASTYRINAAIVEASELLDGHELAITREEMLAPSEVVIGW